MEVAAGRHSQLPVARLRLATLDQAAIIRKSFADNAKNGFACNPILMQ
jgi:hypothetical protein